MELLLRLLPLTRLRWAPYLKWTGTADLEIPIQRSQDRYVRLPDIFLSIMVACAAGNYSYCILSLQTLAGAT